jgi:membrane associated rhomboid family serine protease
MMYLPVYVQYEYRRPPVATLSLIGLQTLVFVLTLGAGREALAPFMLWPDRFAPWQWWTSGFLHADVLHLAGNMLFFWCFGRYLEERLGVWRFLGLYLLLAPLESLAFVFANLGGSIPALGSSGVVSGLMGVVMLAAPAARVKTLIWIFQIFRLTPIHAGLILTLWLFEQLAMVMVGVQGIAFSSHLGGFAAGAALGWWFRTRAEGTGWYMDPQSQNTDDLDARRKAEFYGAMAQEFRRPSPEDQVTATNIPQWLRPRRQPQDGHDES